MTNQNNDFRNEGDFTSEYVLHSALLKLCNHALKNIEISSCNAKTQSARAELAVTSYGSITTDFEFLPTLMIRFSGVKKASLSIIRVYAIQSVSFSLSIRCHVQKRNAVVRLVSFRENLALVQTLTIPHTPLPLMPSPHPSSPRPPSS